jgi:hypothetical protein
VAEAPAVPTPVRPAHTGACVVNLQGALARGPGEEPPPWLPEPVVDARAVVLLVLDGLGWADVSAAATPTIAAMTGGPGTTVVPSTTAVALTSITTGVEAGRHGLVGYRMRTGDGVLNVLGWTVGKEAGPDPARIQPESPFRGRPVPVVTRAEFRTTGFTVAHLRGARFVGWRTTSTIVEHVRLAVAAGEPLVYAYYDGIDKVAHAHGLLDGFHPRELRFADDLVAEILDVLPDDVALLVTADHGQVHWGTAGWRELGDVWGLVATCAGDARFRQLHALPGAEAELHAAAVAAFGDVAWVFSGEELCDDGWLGAGCTKAARKRVGDVVLAPHAPVAFVDPTFKVEQGLVAGHGSLTEAEMLVPIVAARGRA